jgi:hypothetical protein
MYTVFGDFAAKTIGWAQSPFQMEPALSSVGVGVTAGQSGAGGRDVIFGWGVPSGTFARWWRTTTTP